ncbi:MAG: hypothetical protein AB7O24_16520 [Kofleriaceae bacterium]
MLRTAVLFASLLFAGACSAAEADAVAPRPPGPRTALSIAPEKIRAPYDVQVLREGGETLPTYGHRGRFYVQGNAGERYIVRVTNPTPHRIEAVISVDGLDVVDGENGDLRKRGYIVPAYGELRIEGFRTSVEDVATFRFSSVADSYAGQKGKARNVGVIAVALFEEQRHEEQIIIGQRDERRGYFDDAPTDGAPRKSAGRAEASRRPAPPPPATAPQGEAGAPAPRDYRAEADAPEPMVDRMTNRSRPGLGTEFGEQRYSAVSFTRFERATNRPIAIAELRYNDAAGLMALGIPVQPIPDEGEIMTRETADPFPGDRGFARAP